MASILNSIAFQNFYNYYGDFEENKYELKEGLNIIVADNGAGKSKFFNAFLWLFNNQVLDSDKKGGGDSGIRNVKDSYFKILSDKAKFESSKNDKVECGIQIEYTHGTRYRYIIKKSFTAERIGENSFEKGGWVFKMNEVEIDRTELVLTKFKPVYDYEEKMRIIDNLIHPSFRRYSFLQGEEVDNIIDFGDNSSIEDAVNNLTNIAKYDRLNDLLEYFQERANRDLENENKDKDAKSKKLETALNERMRLKTKIDDLKERRERHKSELKEAEKEKKDLDQQYVQAEKKNDLENQLTPLREDLAKKKQEFQIFINRINSYFFDGNYSWIAMGFQEMVKTYIDFKDEYTEARYEKKAQMKMEREPNNYFHFLPVDSPDSVSLQNMIDKEHCYVCDRPAKEGSKAHDYIVKLKNRPNISAKTESFVKNDLNDFFGSIQMDAQPFYSRIALIQDSIGKTRKKEEDLREEINKLTERIEALEGERKDVLKFGVESEKGSLNIISNYEGAIKRIEKAKLQIDEIIGPEIRELETKLKITETDIEKFKEINDIPEAIRQNHTYTKDLFRAAESAKKRVYERMITLLEEHANRHFQDLIASNDLKGGVLRFEKSVSGSISFNYTDKDGNVVTGASEGFQRMKKFSVVMAVISANNRKYNYPLLADAPISAFGEGFTEGFFEATGKVFPQSIVLVKELYKHSDDMLINDLGRNLLEDEKVKTFYVNQVPKEAEQKEIVTNKSRLK